MFNLYRVCLILALLTLSVVHAQVKSPFSGIRVDLKQSKTQALWDQVQKQGWVLVEGMPDQETRPYFTQIQFQSELAMLNRLEKSAGKAKAIWIIHTPLMATPLVTAESPGTITRASIMRRFLENGGIIIAAYSLQDNSKRTDVERATFSQLKSSFPTQLIDLPIEGKYPLDKIGATYFFQDELGEIFEMTNLGTQVNDQDRNATWGLWFQERNHAQSAVTARIQLIMHFLQQAKLDKAHLPSDHALMLSNYFTSVCKTRGVELC